MADNVFVASKTVNMRMLREFGMTPGGQLRDACLWAADEIERLQTDMASMRVFIQDCIETGHDRGALGNLYACRDIIDRRFGHETSGNKS